jgi:hypothetical protein
MVVKALNTMPQQVFHTPAAELRRHDVTCFLAGDDPTAKQVVGGILSKSVDRAGGCRGRHTASGSAAIRSSQASLSASGASSVSRV